ncbi:hypothetical protein AJ79_08611 [Helicocarpus griseus UAMH5409]|uniref:Uncharacterized protein n=1 Tax=Helicocarpus griseus UAMH5409 TaxID=1447875 RepID=A0A2B7WRP7_9EURO|nr:hypothetical protein AJ79_08611 [Helicocarpus griseus UAMH5409]
MARKGGGKQIKETQTYERGIVESKRVVEREKRRRRRGGATTGPSTDDVGMVMGGRRRGGGGGRWSEVEDEDEDEDDEMRTDDRWSEKKQRSHAAYGACVWAPYWYAVYAV